MSPRLLLCLFLISGFAVAPFANLTGRRFWPRVSGMMLLIATLGVVGNFAYELDRSSDPPFSWLCCAGAVLVGVAICIRAFRLQRFHLALALGAVLVCVTVVLHFCVAPSARHCQRAYSSVRKGMTAEQVETVVLREFANSPDYHVVAYSRVPTNGPGDIVFDLRQQDIKLERGTIRVEFVNGRATQSWTSLGGSWISWWNVVGGVALCAASWRRLGGVAEAGNTSVRADLIALLGRLKGIRVRGYQYCSDESAILAKKTLLHFAGEKIRERAYFSHRVARLEPEKDVVEENERV